IQRVIVADIAEALRAVSFGKVDATVDNRAVLNYSMMELMLEGLAFKQDINDEFITDVPLHIAVRNDYPLLQSIINKAMASVTAAEMKTIRKRWLLYESSKKQVDLSRQQRQWIADNPIVHVGGELDWAPFDFVNESGAYDGLAKDYLDLIAEMTGLNFEIHTGQSWNELLASFKEGKLDLLPAIYYSKDREAFAHFSSPYLSLAEFFFSKTGQAKIENLDSLRGKRVAVIKGYEVVDWLRKTQPEIQLVEVDSILEALRLVESGQCLAMISDHASASYIMDKHFITGIESNSMVPGRNTIQVHMAAGKDKKTLADIISLAIKNITQADRRAISSQWMSSMKVNAAAIDLTDKERAWLLRHKKLRFAVDPNWLPIEAISKEGARYDGMMSDILGRISELSGLEFELVVTENWKDSVELARQGKVDMLAAASKTPEREQFLNFSDKTIELNDGVLMRSDASFISDLGGLAGLRVGVSDGTSVHKFLQRAHPELILVPIKGTLNGLQMLFKGEIDALVDNLEVVGYLINQQGFYNLKVVLRLEQKRQLHTALRKSLGPEPLSIINKALRAFPEKDRNAIRQRWVGLKVTEGLDYRLLWKFALGILAVILFIAYSNYKLKKLVSAKTADIERQKEELKQFNKNLEHMVQERTRELAASEARVRAVMDSVEDGIVTITGDGVIESVNRAMQTLFGYPAEELVGRSLALLMPPEEAAQNDGCLIRYQQGGLAKVVGQGAGERTGLRHNGNIVPLDVTVGRVDLTGSELFVGVLRDISERKEAERKLQEAFAELEELNKLTRDSIEYASLIQSALLPDPEVMANEYADHFAVWQPKDVVGGDIYLFEPLRHPDESLLFVIDCTGHGVPGAFVTMLVKAIERQMVTNIVNGDELVSPGQLLGIFNRSMKHLLKQESPDAISNAGFDGAIIYVDRRRNLLRFAGAETPLFYLEDAEVRMIKGNRHSVGYRVSDGDYQFQEHEITLREGMAFYLSTDGYLDQLGGERGFPFGKRRFMSILEKNKDLPMQEQQKALMEELALYKGDYPQIDDLTMVGLRLS
ncbi:MAG: transporter substrate-binding domain-containing protein, partial [Gammaproteobacteria bacterium]|nr:transporter substrate-binding domain-containing protein [Gammaproteobacteria bacterium]